MATGIEPTTLTNSPLRPVDFVREPAKDGVLAIIMTGAELPELRLSGDTTSALTTAIASARFEGKAGSTLSLRGIGPYALIHLIGTAGDEAATRRLQAAGGKAAQDLRNEAHPISIAGNLKPEEATDIALGFQLGQYRFDRYKTQGRSQPPVDKVSIATTDPAAANAAWTGRSSHLAAGVALSRDLANEPGNVLYPETFVTRVRDALAGLANVRIEVLDEAAMRRLGMGSITGVAQGSARPPRIMVVEYRGASGAPLALVGKGVTFDSGGISLKPGTGMWEMKSDMSGAASVMGALLSLARSKAPINVVAVAALAENMPDASAQRPGDVVRTMSGKTIEIINTDAEGRLVLADANEYVVSRYKPAAVVNIATLTGSVVQALNTEYAGLFSRDDRLAAALLDAGTQTAEEVWRLPLHPNHLDTMKSDIADLRNAAEGARLGASLGAAFVGAFVDPATPWAHLDIAGVNWADRSAPLMPKGASGWGVRILDQFARDWRP